MARRSDTTMVTGDEEFPYLPEGFLLKDEPDAFGYKTRWDRARADSFAPVD